MSAKGPRRTSAKRHCVGFPLGSGDVRGRYRDVKGKDLLLGYYTNTKSYTNAKINHGFQIKCRLKLHFNSQYVVYLVLTKPHRHQNRT